MATVVGLARQFARRVDPYLTAPARLFRRSAVLDYLTPRSNLARGTTLVRVRCAGCGHRVATIEDHGGVVRVTAGRHRYIHLIAVSCPTHGRLVISWARLDPRIVRARRTRRVVTVSVPPVASMP